MSKADESTVTSDLSAATEQPADDDTILSVRNVSKHYGGVVALEDVSLSIKENEVLSIVGDNGAGKSTFIKLLSGVIPATSGEFYMRDPESHDLEQIVLESPAMAKRAGIETVFQDMSLSFQHDVAANVFMGREPLKDGLSGKLFRRLDREYMEQRSIEALDEIGFEIDPNAITEELSGGQQQAIAVARALISDPRVVILDEPTAEVSVEGSQKILDLIEELQASGKTVIFITHNLQEVFDVADRVAVLRSGSLVAELENDGTIDREELVGHMTGAIQQE
ncbi:ATP-binding cassette domain-containing protein [Haloarcula nitratireducens]|uniref:ATP-binding cassette domain-containing protein n=1 Tax=Haloarcula nitratireducens TaxID=2487749 RepID=A0AAW4PFY0_9EURY|nr:ATP-binding cassette domain-containing protein [Halomicroarcula nitratireducens]MBX0296874.1 ATP-binding cassette domain-containing protein [Halomicroarcula nitratireducens]